MRVEKVEIPPDILSCGLHLFYSLISKCYQHCAFIAGGKKGLPPRRPPPCRPSSVARHRERGDPMLSTSSLRWAAPCALAALWCAQAAVCAGRLWSPCCGHGKHPRCRPAVAGIRVRAGRSAGAAWFRLTARHRGAPVAAGGGPHRVVP